MKALRLFSSYIQNLHTGKADSCLLVRRVFKYRLYCLLTLFFLKIKKMGTGSSPVLMVFIYFGHVLKYDLLYIPEIRMCIQLELNK